MPDRVPAQTPHPLAMTPLLFDWLSTAWIHATLLAGIALGVLLFLRAPVLRIWVLRIGLFGGLLTATAQVLVGGAFVSERAWTVVERSVPNAGAGIDEVLRLPVGTVGAGGEAPARGPAATADRIPRTAGAAAQPGSPPATVDWVAWVGTIWLVVAVALVAHLVWRRATFLRSLRREPVREGGLLRAIHGLRADRGRVRVSRSSHVGAPLALSGREICVPDRRWDGLPEDERLGALAHELAHIRQRDPLWFFLGQIVERLFFVQPLLVHLRRRMQAEAELLCDDWAARRTGNPLALARCLANVASWGRNDGIPAWVPSMAASRSELVRRVERILSDESEAPSRGRLAGFALCAGAGIFAFACHAPRVESTDATPEPPEAEAEDPETEEAILVPSDPATIPDLAVRLLQQSLVLTVAPDGATTMQRGADGTVVGSYLLDDDDDLRRFHQALETEVGRFPRLSERVGTTETAGRMDALLADGKVRIRADVSTPYRYVQRIMQLCGSRQVMAWDLELEAAEPGSERYRVPLPNDVGVFVPEEIEEGADPRGPLTGLELRLDAEDAGTTIRVLPVHERSNSWHDEPDDPSGADRFGVAEDEALLAHLRAAYRETNDLRITIDARPGVLYSDVASVLEATIAAGFTEILFVGEYR